MQVKLENSNTGRRKGINWMRRNKKILIWIGILTLIALILLMVACESGIFLSRVTQPPGEQITDSGETGQTIPDSGSQNAVDPINPGEPDAPAPLTVGKPYSEKLAEEGANNVLIVGEDKLNDLYDTIGIVSIDKNNKTVKLIMIPRDTYIEYNRDIISSLEEINLAHKAGVYKINFAHHIGNKIGYSGKFNSGPISFLAGVVEEKFSLEISDYVKINLSGFRKLIDHLDGVDMNVPYNMDYDDPVQDLHIHITKGPKRLYGYDAEGFVRFRQGYKEDGSLFEIGDIGRKRNQLNFMQQLIKQKGTIGNIGKLPGTIDILGKNIQHSIGLGDVLQTYMGVAKDIISDGYTITSVNIDSDKSTRVDGASYLVLD